MTIYLVASFDLVASIELASFDSYDRMIRHDFYFVASFDLASFGSYDCVSNMISILLRVLNSHHSAVMIV